MKGLYIYVALVCVLGVPLCAFAGVKNDQGDPLETLKRPPVSEKPLSLHDKNSGSATLSAEALQSFNKMPSALQESTPHVESKVEQKGLYVTIYAQVHENQRYTVSIQAARETPLFIFPTQIDPNDLTKKNMIQSSLLRRFFDFDKQKFEFDSQFLIKEPTYQQTINNLSEIESKRILVQQSFLSRARNYYLESIIGSHLKKARLIAGDALVRLNRALRDVFEENAFKLLDKKQFAFENINIKDPAYSSDSAKERIIYNAIREFGQVIGFEMPSIEKPWYVRHKGKIALTAGALALLTYMHYSNALGTRTPTAQETTATVQRRVASPSPQVATASTSPWYARSVAAVQTKLSNLLSGVKNQAVQSSIKHTSKAVVHRLATHEGVKSSPDMSFKGQGGDIAGHALAQELGEAYGYELVPKPGFQRPPSLPKAVRTGVVKQILSPEGADVAKSYELWK